MSVGESDAKFPGQQGIAIPPPQTRENPGQVYPKSDPCAAPLNTVSGTGTDLSSGRYLGNPYLQSSIFGKLDKSLSEAIHTIECEQSEMDSSPEEGALVEKLKGWRDELEGIMTGHVDARQGDSAPVNDVTAEEGGLFKD